MSDEHLLSAAAAVLARREADADESATLRFQCCEACGFVRHPVASRCPECLSDRWRWQPDPGLGVVWSTCTYHRAFDPAFADAVPYNVVLVELDSGPRLLTNVLGVAAEELRIGLRVVASPREVLPGRFVVYVVPAVPGTSA